MSSRAEVRRQLRRQGIIAAAEAELGDVGFPGTTLESVGRRLGLSKSALYHYVDSKDALLALLLEDVLVSIRDEAASRAEEGDRPLALLRRLAHAHVRVSVERPAGQLIVSHVDALAADESTARLLKTHERVARDLVALAVGDGQLRGLDTAVATTVLFGALNTIPRAFDRQGARSLDEVVEIALDLLLDGWRTSAS